jgi:hypothetical protein
MDRNYPFIYLYGDSNKSKGDAAKVRIAFGKERKDLNRSEDVEWSCANVCPIAAIMFACADHQVPNQ